jgi:DNA-binding response OmpR family regulator
MARSANLLVVDDDPSVRSMLLEYLGGHGFAVRAAADGAAMRDELERELLDLRLPGEDGLTLARFLRERYDVGIVMITGSDDVIDRIVGLENGGDEIPTTAMEYDLIRVFLANPNRVLSRDQLLMHTRNREWEPFDRSIDIRIGRLRRKVEPAPGGEPRCIRTVRNAGYMDVPLG